MAYIYESIQPGLFNFSIPGQNKTVSLFTGSRVVVENKLTGGLLRVLRFVGETENETTVDNTISEATKQKAKVEDKITNVKEIVEIPKENIRFADTIVGFLLGTIIATMFGFFYGNSIKK